jgi:hypothetical protein
MARRHLLRRLERYLRHVLRLPDQVEELARKVETCELTLPLLSRADELAGVARKLDAGMESLGLIEEVSLLGLPVLAEHPEAFRCQLTADSPFPLFNPSIIQRDDGGFYCLARSSSLVNDAEWDYRCEQGEHATTNYAFLLDKELRVEACEVLDDRALEELETWIKCGLEDCRLFRFQGEIRGIGSVAYVKAGEYLVRQVVFRLQGIRIEDPCYGPSLNRLEKNWVPIEDEDAIRILYRLNPPAELVLKDGVLAWVSGLPPEHQDWNLRGGTPLVRFGKHYLGIAHSRQLRIGRRMYYLHCFVVFDRSMRHVETSQFFFLRRRGLEFACGLQLSDGQAYISYGVADRAAEILRIPVKAIMKYLVADSY